MKKQTWLAGLAGVILVVLGAWGAAGAAAAETFPSAAAQGEQEPRKLMTISIPGDIPVADSDGEIPGADAVPTAQRDTVTFGSYPQGAKGEVQPLQWIVLDEKEGYTLLMTKDIIGSKGWVKAGRDGTTWAETDLRQWLDTDFYDHAFTADDKKHIALFHATAPGNPRYDTPAGEETADPVSLLNYQELVHYMPTDKERQTRPTDYAIAQGCYQNKEGNSAWWLRSPGPTAAVPEHLASWGNLGARTHYIDDASIGVRPVIWVDSAYLYALQRDFQVNEMLQEGKEDARRSVQRVHRHILPLYKGKF